ncbi:sensor histidine kinase, partial [bacterium]|nr:sensor histidine kinase [bacterium]
SNSLKHAFPNGRKGTISVSFKLDKHFILLVEDDGIGLPDNFKLDKSKTLGLQLVQTFIAQLKGSLEVKINEGTKYKITFIDR